VDEEIDGKVVTKEIVENGMTMLTMNEFLIASTKVLKKMNNFLRFIENMTT
jgi:hypothetical protein